MTNGRESKLTTPPTGYAQFAPPTTSISTTIIFLSLSVYFNSFALAPDPNTVPATSAASPWIAILLV